MAFNRINTVEDQDFDHLSQECFIGAGDIDPQQTKEFLTCILELGLQFKQETKWKNEPVISPTSVSFDTMPVEGISLSNLMTIFSELARRSHNCSSPQFMGFPDSANSKPGIAAGLLIQLLNQNMANHDLLSPYATFMEMEVIHWFRSQFDYDVPSTYTSASEIGGVCTIGGCISNTIGLMAAREKLFPGSVRKGLPVIANKLRVLIPAAIGHYSIRATMAWLGLGEDNICLVPVDRNFRMKLDELDQIIDEERAAGNYILACVAYAGDSRTMCVDNLKEIATHLQFRNVWFHVDACHGSQLVFSRQHKYKVEGIEMADSITADPHKIFWLPYSGSIVLFKDSSSLSNLKISSDLILNTQWSLGQVSPLFGSKAFDALKIWAVIKFFGLNGLETLIDGRIELTKKIQKEISQRSDLVLLNQTDINSCIFVFVPEQCQQSKLSRTDADKIGNATTYIHSKILNEGDFFVHGFPLRKLNHELFPDNLPQINVMRIMNGNPLTTIKHVNILLDRVVSLGWEFIGQQGYVIVSQPKTQPHPIYDILRTKLNAFFQDVPHSALIYGSSCNTQNVLMSDIDLMVICADEFCTSENNVSLVELFIKIMHDFHMRLDEEVPLNKKLLIPLSFAEKASFAAAGQLTPHCIPTIEENAEYLRSNELLARLVFNVLTVPTLLIDGSSQFIESIRLNAEKSLVQLMISRAGKEEFDAARFVDNAHGDSVRKGRDFLGYKSRPDVFQHLERIWHYHGQKKEESIISNDICEPSDNN